MLRYDLREQRWKQDLGKEVLLKFRKISEIRLLQKVSIDAFR